MPKKKSKLAHSPGPIGPPVPVVDFRTGHKPPGIIGPPTPAGKRARLSPFTRARRRQRRKFLMS